MAYGQPFYTYSNGYPQNPFYGGYNAQQQQQQQPNYLYGNQQQIPLNAQNQPLNTYQQPQPQYQPQQYQSVQQANNAPTQSFPIKDIRFVTSDEAKAFIVMPNSNALLIDTVNGIAYFKSADNVGQSITETYRFTKMVPNEEQMKTSDLVTEKKIDVDLNDFIKKQDVGEYIKQYGFVTKEEYNTLKTGYNSLHSELDIIKKQITANNGGNVNGRKQQREENS